MKARPERGGRRWLLALVPPLLWFAHFSALYGLASFGAAGGMRPSQITACAWLLTGVAGAAVAGFWFASVRQRTRANEPEEGMRAVATALAALSVAGIAFQALPLALT